mgnify:FL=1|jgi:hypothetical protein
MVYQIDVAINLNKVSNLSEIKKKIMEKAYDCKLEKYFLQFEHIGRNRKIFRNHCILTFFFIENDELLSDFIRFIKKIKNVNIEMVGLDAIKFKIIYASKKYLNIMEKEHANNYLELKRKNELYKQDSIIFKTLSKK